MGDPQETKAKLIEAAINLFASKGFFRSSIRDIAREMDMSIANIYHYFGSKEGLLLAILQYSALKVVQQLRQVAASDLEPLARFRLLLRTHLLISGSQRKEAKIYQLDREQLTDEGHEINRDIQREILGIYRQILSELADKGLLRTRSVTITAFNILGVINWFLRWHRPDGAMSIDEVVEETMSFIFHGALVPGCDPPIQD